MPLEMRHADCNNLSHAEYFHSIDHINYTEYKRHTIHYNSSSKFLNYHVHQIYVISAC